MALAEKISSPVPAFLRSSDISSLVDEGAALDARMKRDALRMADIKTALVQRGAGEYYGTRPEARALVIYPSPKIAQLKEGDPVAAAVSAAIGKSNFSTLFDQVVIWKPVKSCKDFAVRLLAPAKLKKFLELTEADCPAQVRFG